MTTEEVSNVKNFTIGNEFGKVIWEGRTDLLTILRSEEHTFKDLSEVFNIEHTSLTVYEDDSVKPQKG